MYVELGALTPSAKKRRDGTLYNAKGEITLFAGYAWRMSESGFPIGGNASNPQERDNMRDRLIGKTVVSIGAHGRPPELLVKLSDGCHLETSSPVGEGPSWTLSFTAMGLGHLGVTDGRIQHDDRTS